MEVETLESSLPVVALKSACPRTAVRHLHCNISKKFRMSLVDDEEDTLDSLGDKMSQNMRDIKTNFTSRKCGAGDIVSGDKGKQSL